MTQPVDSTLLIRTVRNEMHETSRNCCAVTCSLSNVLYRNTAARKLNPRCWKRL